MTLEVSADIMLEYRYTRIINYTVGMEQARRKNYCQKGSCGVCVCVCVCVCVEVFPK